MTATDLETGFARANDSAIAPQASDNGGLQNFAGGLIRPTMTPALGIIMLDAAFTRPVGDAGNAASWPFPVLIERASGAFAAPVVTGQFEDVQPFVDAGHRLISRGACAITTTCGFLVRLQQKLQSEFTVPVRTSTLTQFARLQAALGPDRRVAILTIDSGALDSSIRVVAGIPDDALIFALARESHFVSAILDASVALDTIRAEHEWVALAEACLRDHPSIALWLFECANMPPYAGAVSRATGLPVYDALTLGRGLYEAANS